MTNNIINAEEYKYPQSHTSDKLKTPDSYRHNFESNSPPPSLTEYSFESGIPPEGRPENWVSESEKSFTYNFGQSLQRDEYRGEKSAPIPIQKICKGHEICSRECAVGVSPCYNSGYCGSASIISPIAPYAGGYYSNINKYRFPPKEESAIKKYAKKFRDRIMQK